MRPQTLSLDCEALEEFRLKLDAALRVIVPRMIEKRNASGTVSAKVDITVNEIKTTDGVIQRFMAMEPAVEIRMTSRAKAECDIVNNLALRIDDDTNEVRIASGQISIEELMNEGEEA